jgi:hypothetical protein
MNKLAITHETVSLDHIKPLNRNGEPISRKWCNVMNFATFCMQTRAPSLTKALQSNDTTPSNELTCLYEGTIIKAMNATSLDVNSTALTHATA